MKRIFLGCVSLMMLFGFCCNSLAQTTQRHVVQRGETYAFIAKKYGITEDELIKANPGHKVCYVGLKLVIPVSECVVESSASPAIVSEQEAQPVKESQVLAASDYEVPTPSLAKPKKEKKKKSGKSFWKALGSIASGIGEVIVGTTDALAETGLLDKTGKVGDALGFTADVTNLTQGKVSNYMSQTRSGKRESREAEANVADGQSESPNQGDLPALKQKLARLEQEKEQARREFAIEASSSSSRAPITRNKKKIQQAKAGGAYQRYRELNIEIGNVKEQISKLEGWHDQWIAQQEANRANARAENQRLKNKPKYDATDWRNKQRVKDAALDQNADILADPVKWVEAHGAKGTVDIYKRNAENIQKANDYNKNRK